MQTVSVGGQRQLVITQTGAFGLTVINRIGNRAECDRRAFVLVVVSAVVPVIAIITVIALVAGIFGRVVTAAASGKRNDDGQRQDQSDNLKYFFHRDDS